MAKRSRRPTRGDIPAPRSEGGTAPAGAGLSEARPARVTRTRRSREAGPLERYRSLIFGGAAVIAILIVGWLFFQGSAGGAYACDSLLTPGPVESLTPRPATPTPSPTPSATPSPTPSPASSPSASAGATESPSASPSPSPSPSPTAQPEPTARLGFSTTVLGRGHVRDPNQQISYGFCPPTSGAHINAANRGPIRAAVYPKTEEQVPGGWLHNLEHGYTVALYRCTGPDDCPSDAEMAQLQAFFDQAPTSVNPACPTKIIVARLDSMDTRFALLGWGRALLVNEFDLDTALIFAQQWTDHEAVPERGLC